MSRISRITYYILLITFLSATGIAHGQISRITDSLKQAILSHNSNDNNKVLQLAALAHNYHQINSDSELVYAKQAYDLSSKLNFTAGKIIALEAMGSAKFQAGQYDSALNCFNTGMQLCYKSNDHSEGCVLLNNIANTLFR